MTALPVLIVLTLAIAALAYAVWWNSRTDLVADRLRRRVIVTRHDGTGIVGVLLETDRRCVVVTSAETQDDRGQLVPIDGEVLVLAEDIAYMQFP